MQVASLITWEQGLVWSTPQELKPGFVHGHSWPEPRAAHQAVGAAHRVHLLKLEKGLSFL